MDFGEALKKLKAGERVKRLSCKGWIALQRPDVHSKMGLPYLYKRTKGGKLVPWAPSQADLMAEDWQTA